MEKKNQKKKKNLWIGNNVIDKENLGQEKG